GQLGTDFGTTQIKVCELRLFVGGMTPMIGTCRDQRSEVVADEAILRLFRAATGTDTAIRHDEVREFDVGWHMLRVNEPSQFEGATLQVDARDPLAEFDQLIDDLRVFPRELCERA